MTAVRWPGALAWRLGRHHLEPSATTSVADVVADLGAVAAQLDPSAAELGVRTRLRDSRPGDVDRALSDGSLVRTFAFRGATHLMTPEQAGVHLALRASTRMWERSSWREYYRLAPGDWPALGAVVHESLAPGPLTRADLAAAVTAHPPFRHLGTAFTDPQATFLKALAWQGVLSLGPGGGPLTLQALGTNPRWTGLPDVDEAGPRAVEAYLHAYGPATPEHLRYWLTQGLGVRFTAVRGWLDALGDRVSRVAVDDEPMLVLRDDVPALAASGPTDVVRLLPQFDQWVLGPGTADVHVVPAELRAAVSRGARVVVVGGVVAGTWTITDQTVVVTWRPGADPRDGDVVAEVDRLAGLLGRPLRPATS
ncbi:DNA glycosylase AlkZ-like family protein [Cellulomonas dongxiuzhuiae]|uniref:DNA glycosylase AlkZ-like family protein n=1 Tax=Cellulomonas dongxiuzhuiae TaxID=2819979 RepID=UPI001AAE2FBC|nr:crosslink repair DNA glycosylase YcaQ family protein [Cellulomonas dongxiuzhuiae]MBO3086990.1 winged helix DNA-binding domain-containing protein [Cellulomonas dongxiuzhuiae]